MFTALHCAPLTIDTHVYKFCREYTPKQLLEMRACCCFLGDFLHHRATIRVDLLNNVLQELSSWQVPLIMIPGNHG
jgi:hypothetical protein